MRNFILLLFICSALTLSAKGVKINYKGEIRPFSFKIEKMEMEGEEAVFYIKVKQQKNFSYSISFTDCYIATPTNPNVVKGELKTWNDDKKIYRDSKTISDSEDEKFTLSFPLSDITDTQTFDIKIGNILDRNKTEIIFKGVAFKK